MEPRKARYRRTLKGKAARSRYRRSAKGRATTTRYRKSAKGKAAAKRYQQSEAGRKTQARARAKAKSKPAALSGSDRATRCPTDGAAVWFGRAESFKSSLDGTTGSP
jgi:hypothetical protein